MTTLRVRLGRLTVAVLAGACVLVLLTATPAMAEAPWWHVSSETAPTNLPPEGEGLVLVVLSNLGDAPIEGAKEQVRITTKLPPGLIAKTITGPFFNKSQVECTLATLKCTFNGVVYPYEQIAITLKVKVEEPNGAVTRLPVEVGVEGGGAARIAKTVQAPVGTPGGYGVAGFELSPFNENGTPARGAGEHPFQLTTTLTLNQTATQYPVQMPKDLSFNLPPGLVGNPNAVTQCTMADLAPLNTANLCSPSSVVEWRASSPANRSPSSSQTVPVFNLVSYRASPLVSVSRLSARSRS